MLLVVYLTFLIFFSFLLIKSTEILVASLEKLSKISKIGKFAITSIIMALATSLPELFVSITAALEKQPNLALGNIIGSNIADLSLVIGGAALIGGTIGVVGDFLKKDIFYAFLAGSLPVVMLIDSRISKVEGLMLLAIYGIYQFSVLQRRRGRVRKDRLVRGVLQRLNTKRADKQIAWIFFGIVLLIFSADAIVKIAGLIAREFDVPVLLVGLFLVAVGTSLPELSFSISALVKKQVGMVFGDLLGSIVANSTLILGVTSLINPIVLDGGFKVYFWAAVFYFLIFIVFWFFVKTKRKLERWEGVILLLLYLVFVIFEFWRLNGKRASSILFSEPLK